jgi:molecular chaperone HtpG
MEKVLKQMPNATDAKAEIVMEINKDHPIAAKLKELFDTDKEKLEK